MKSQSKVPQRVKKLLSELPVFESATIRVTAIAEKLGVHRSHLTKVFTQAEGQSLENYLIKRRMILCMIYLVEHPNRQISKVSKRFGFSRTDYFIKVFKKHVGFTPQHFREFWFVQKSRSWK